MFKYANLTPNLTLFFLLGKRVNKISIRTRYSETDQMGIIYHGNYAQYFEMGRVEWLRNLGISYRWMEENGMMLPVISLNIRFKKPARYDDPLLIKTTLREKPSVRIVFDYEICNEDSMDILTTADSTLVFMNAKTNKPMLCPDFLMEKLNEITF